tara:strand:- start:6282 stop:6908 length:627 start_codon:yes stop_codon:yes gene_type:complete
MFTQPKLPESVVRSILTKNGVDQTRLAVLAIRGYRLDSLGKPGVNDRRIYDDAHFIVWPDGFAAFNGNTDPNGYRKGFGGGSRKGMAVLKPGIHLYGTGKHKGRLAFRGCEKFTVVRDGDPPYEDLGFHAINWHSGGVRSTSSLGCQTNRPADFNTLRPLIYSLLEKYKNPFRNNDWGQRVRSFPYVLLEETQRRAGFPVVSRRYLNE